MLIGIFGYTAPTKIFTWNQQEMGDLFWQQLHFIDYEDKHLIGKHGLKGLLGMVESGQNWM